MHSLSESHQHRLNTLKQLYLGKCLQVSQAEAAHQSLRYQVLLAELMVLKAAIPEQELPPYIFH